MHRLPSMRPAASRIAGFAIGLAVMALIPGASIAESPAQTCDRLAGDLVKMNSIDGEAAVPACSDAVTAAPQDKHLQYEYARALERSGKRDQAKQIYQWIASDGYAPANVALARMAGPLTGDAADREKFAQKLDAIATIAARIAKATPRDHDDPNTVLAKTGKDATKILAWVKANTRIIPYAGMLRGASGVLMDRAGNSLDRALFLADLLHRAGYNVRIARAQISPQTAEALRVRFVNSTPKPTPPVMPDKAALLKAIGADPRLDPKLIEKAVDETIASSQKFNADVKDLYGKVLPAMLQAIGNDPARDARLAADADAVLRDHFWVQHQNGAGWDDLDPDADIAGKLTAVSTFAPSDTPSNLKHRVTMRLILETLKDGKLSEIPLLQQSWLPSEVSDKPIVINHALYPQIPVDGLLKRPNPQADFIQSLADASVVMPTLQVGAQVTRGQLYDFTGNVQAPTPENLASMGGTAIVNGQSLSRGIASAFGDGATASPLSVSSQTIATAEWLEIDIAVPGRLLEKHRRAIFDLIGATGRANPASIAVPAITDELKKQRALALNATIDAFVFGATPSPHWATRVSMDSIARTVTRVAKSVRMSLTFAESFTESASRIELQLWGWSAERTPLPYTPERSPVAPNVALLWRTLVPDSKGREDSQVDFDIVANETAGDTAFSHRVAQGILDTVTEHATLGGTGINAASEYAADLQSNLPWRVFQPARSDQIAALFLPGDAKIQLQTALADGDLVMLPTTVSKSGTFTWWRIDPRTGRTLGVGKGGMGAEMAEYANIVLRGVLSGYCLGSVAVQMNKIVEGNGGAGSSSAKLGAKAAFCMLSGILGGVGGIPSGAGLMSSNAGMTLSVIAILGGFS